MKSTFRFVVGPVLALLWVYPALAQFGPLAIESCEDYASLAMSQVQMATGCNFEGSRWSLNLGEHETWCKGASPRDRGREYDGRRQALVGCRGDGGVISVTDCNDYAARARSQIDLAKSLGSNCRFQGMRWSENLVQHMLWCNRTSASRHEFEDAARRKELAECGAPK